MCSVGTVLSPNVYTLEEWTGPKLSISALGERLRVAVESHKPMSAVIDVGDLWDPEGKRVVSELSSRFSMLPAEAFPSSARVAASKLLGDAILGGRFHARADGPFASQAPAAEWSRAASGYIVGVSPVIAAAVAAYWRAQGWLFRPVEVPPQPGTEAWEQRIKRKLFEKAQRDVQSAKQQKEYALGNFGIDMGGDNFGVDDSGDFGWPESRNRI